VPLVLQADILAQLRELIYTSDQTMKQASRVVLLEPSAKIKQSCSFTLVGHSLQPRLGFTAEGLRQLKLPTTGR